MSRLNKDEKNLLIGALIGGVGLCAASFLFSKGSKEDKGLSIEDLSLDEMRALMKKMEKTLEMCHLDKPAKILKGAEKGIRKNEDRISSVIDMISSGIHLLEAFKR